MKDMNIKQILGANAHWTVNKELANKIGLMPTLLLQHLIDLDQSFFEGKAGGFYQQQSRLLKDLPITLNHLRQSTKKLVELELLEAKRKGVPPKYFYIINYDNLCRLIGVTFKGVDSKRLESEQERLRIKEEEETKNISNTNKTNKNNIDKVLDVLVEKYPGNIGSHKVIIKALKELSKAELILTIKNLDRYSKAWDGFVHNLRNYIEQRHFTDKEIEKRETKNAKQNITNIDTKDFDTNY